MVSLLISLHSVPGPRFSRHMVATSGTLYHNNVTISSHVQTQFVYEAAINVSIHPV